MTDRTRTDDGPLAEALMLLENATLLQVDTESGAIERAESSSGATFSESELDRLQGDVADEVPYVFEHWEEYGVNGEQAETAGSFVVSMEAGRMIGYARSADHGTVWAALVEGSSDIDGLIALLRNLVGFSG